MPRAITFVLNKAQNNGKNWFCYDPGGLQGAVAWQR